MADCRESCLRRVQAELRDAEAQAGVLRAALCEVDSQKGWIHRWRMRPRLRRQSRQADFRVSAAKAEAARAQGDARSARDNATTLQDRAAQRRQEAKVAAIKAGNLSVEVDAPGAEAGDEPETPEEELETGPACPPVVYEEEQELAGLIQGTLLLRPRDARPEPDLYAFFELQSRICAHVGIASNLRGRLYMHYSRTRGDHSRFRDMVAQGLLGVPAEQARGTEAAHMASKVIRKHFGFRLLYTVTADDSKALEGRAKARVGDEPPSYGWPYLDDPITRPYVSGKPREELFEAARMRLGL